MSNRTVMATLPLLTHQCARDTVAWLNGQAVNAAQFLADVHQLQTLLPSGRHLLNACNNRYWFTVGLAAALLSEKICLLPPTHTPEMISALTGYANDLFCLSDQAHCTIDLPTVFIPPAIKNGIYRDTEPAAAATWVVPGIANDQTVAIVFTSGSTGTPVAHRKSWGALVRNVRAGAEVLGLHDSRQHHLVGTVPPQHMYGLESTILVALQSSNAIVAADTFFPADICAALNAVPEPRVLVSTPIHLRTFAESGLPTPRLEKIVCATAPLTTDSAKRFEQRFETHLTEIYGSTETGQIATRDTARSTSWQLFGGVQLHRRQDVVWASEGHVEEPVPMSDMIEIVDGQHFYLNGRASDMVNVAGKRNSLSYLTVQLNAIDGVRDGVFFMPDETVDDATAQGITRLCAVAVAPGMTHTNLMAALKTRIDVAFLPRPLIFVDALPRNATGKLTRQTLLALLHRHHARHARHAPA